jgi:hypothetical protein
MPTIRNTENASLCWGFSEAQVSPICLQKRLKFLAILLTATGVRLGGGPSIKPLFINGLTEVPGVVTKALQNCDVRGVGRV